MHLILWHGISCQVVSRLLNRHLRYTCMVRPMRLAAVNVLSFVFFTAVTSLYLVPFAVFSLFRWPGVWIGYFACVRLDWPYYIPYSCAHLIHKYSHHKFILFIWHLHDVKWILQSGSLFFKSLGTTDVRTGNIIVLDGNKYGLSRS